MIIKGFRERNNVRIAGITCGMFPDEIAASAGLVPIRLPSYAADCCVCDCISAIDNIEELCDILVVPRGCSGKNRISVPGLKLYEFDCPSGWGTASSEHLASSLDALLRSAGCASLKGLDPARLRDATREYNSVRRTVRGIASIRRDKPELVSCEDLAIVFEAASVFPPAVITGHMASVLNNLNLSESSYGGGLVPSLAYASYMKDARLIDSIEDAGCLIADDDFCNGRRQFDMSYNDASDNLLFEMLDSYSYRPRCPSVRTLEERFELLYKMMKYQGIELIIFIQDLCCPGKLRDIDALRIRLMRAGIDPIVVTSQNAVDRIRTYISRK
jgi:benzoyl-CoA reductase/2-hydroxyglutaryl-CoA dehydratase subunit BcrC/BadD/HgdB